MITYDKLWSFMQQTNQATGKRRKLYELYDDPANLDRHEPIGISKPTIDRMRQGQAISLDTIDRLCERLGLQPGDIMEWIPGPQPEYIRPADRQDEQQND